MKNWKLILFFMPLLFAFSLVSNPAQATVKLPLQQNESQIAAEGTHLLAFLQPESVHHVVGNVKASGPVFGKLNDRDFFQFLSLQQHPLQKYFATQDINRCHKVSVLLFPFHIFW